MWGQGGAVGPGGLVWEEEEWGWGRLGGCSGAGVATWAGGGRQQWERAGGLRAEFGERCERFGGCGGVGDAVGCLGCVFGGVS